MPGTQIVNLMLPAVAMWVPVASAATRAAAQRLGFKPPAVHRLGQAIEEALLHALGLGFGGELDVLHVCLDETDQSLRLRVISRGLPLDEASLPRFDPDRLFSQGDMTGISTHLLRNMVDRVEFAVHEGGGREIILWQALPQ